MNLDEVWVDDGAGRELGRLFFGEVLCPIRVVNGDEAAVVVCQLDHLEKCRVWNDAASGVVRRRKEQEFGFVSCEDFF